MTSNYFLVLLLIITLISFQAGEAIHNAIISSRKKNILILSLIGLLIPLGFFKYYNFGIGIINQVTNSLQISLPIPLLDLILPIGISFFTFSAISYVVDIYRGEIKPEEKFYRYALFISYFPHLLSGPIVRAGQFLPQLKNRISLTSTSLKAGITLMMWGFVKKIIIADNCAPIVNAIFAHPTDFNSLYIIIGTLLFGIQIYCDFSGYIDIALGAAELIGLHLPKNFNRPYLSASPTEFWRRWNITLSSFIRDYIYIPLGGNRKGRIMTYINLELSMLLCGLWHGAAWNFIIWGGYHGILLSIHKLTGQKIRSSRNIINCIGKYPSIFIKILITQYFIFLGWILFRVGNIPDLIYCVNKYVLIDFRGTQPIMIGNPIFDTLMTIVINMNLMVKIVTLVIILAGLILTLRNDKIMGRVVSILVTEWPQKIASLPLHYWILIMTFMTLLLLCLTPNANPEFIYFQF